MTSKTENLLLSLFGTDEDGNVFLRVVPTEPKGEISNAVSTQGTRNLDVLLAKAIVLDEKGKPAIRLASVVGAKTIEEQERERRTAMAKAEADRQAANAKDQEKRNKAFAKAKKS